MTIKNDLQNQLFKTLNLKETDELLDIWKTNDRVAWTNEAFLAIQEILQERLGSVPLQGVENTIDEGEDEEDEDSGEYTLITPSVLKAVIISSIILIAGVLLKSVSILMPPSSEEQFLTVSGIVMIIAGITGFVVFGLMSLIESGDIIRFRPIHKIVLSQSGLTLIKKDQSIDLIISWKQIKTIQIHGITHLVLFVIQTSWEPLGLTLNLLDGSMYKIPLNTILKQKDCLRIIRTLSRYASSVVKTG
jgi:hypothetical protein